MSRFLPPTDAQNSSFSGIWSHEEAEKCQVVQLSTSGCGVTALATLIPYLITKKQQQQEKEQEREQEEEKEPLGKGGTTSIAISSTASPPPPPHVSPTYLLSPPPSLEEIKAGSVLRLRKNDDPLPQYLASRSIAGCTGQELVDSVAIICPALISGEFFSYARITQNGAVGVIEWLESQLKSGRALVATLNLQLYGNDAWHHQCIYGVDITDRKIFCTNPIEVYTEADFVALISTPSVLLVRREDILLRNDRPGGDASVYLQEKWMRLNVESQIKQTILDDKKRFVVIPAAYEGGISVFTSI